MAVLSRPAQLLSTPAPSCLTASTAVGDEFSYREVLSLKTGCMGAKFATGAIKAGMWSLRQKWLHPLLAAFSPKPGKGKPLPAPC